MDEDDLASTCASATDLAEFDESIDEAHLATLTIVETKFCKCCTHSSGELNPLERGGHCRSAKFPCWPWWQGSFIRPKGLV